MGIFGFCLVSLIMLNQSIHLSRASVNRQNFGPSSFLWDYRHIVSFSLIYTFSIISWWLYLRWLLFIEMSQSFPEIWNIYTHCRWFPLHNTCFPSISLFSIRREVNNTSIEQSRPSGIPPLVLIQIFGMQWLCTKILGNSMSMMNLYYILLVKTTAERWPKICSWNLKKYQLK